MLSANKCEKVGKMSLVIKLKQKIACLEKTIKKQKGQIEIFERSIKSTKINEQQLYIQELNDENKRLLGVIENLRTENRHNYSKKSLKEKSHRKKNSQLSANQSTLFCSSLCRTLDEALLMENEKLKNKLIRIQRFRPRQGMRVQSTLNDRRNIELQKNISEFDSIVLKRYELEAELENSLGREEKLGQKIKELQLLLENSIRINESMKNLQQI